METVAEHAASMRTAHTEVPLPDTASRVAWSVDVCACVVYELRVSYLQYETKANNINNNRAVAILRFCEFRITE